MSGEEVTALPYSVTNEHPHPRSLGDYCIQQGSMRGFEGPCERDKCPGSLVSTRKCSITLKTQGTKSRVLDLEAVHISTCNALTSILDENEPTKVGMKVATEPLEERCGGIITVCNWDCLAQQEDQMLGPTFKVLERDMPRTQDQSLPLFIYNPSTKSLHGGFQAWIEDEWDVEHPQVRVHLKEVGLELKFAQVSHIIQQSDGVRLKLTLHETQELEQLFKTKRLSETEQTLTQELEQLLKTKRLSETEQTLVKTLNDRKSELNRLRKSPVPTLAGNCHERIAACPCAGGKNMCPCIFENRCLVQIANDRSKEIVAYDRLPAQLKSSPLQRNLAHVCRDIEVEAHKQASWKIFCHVNKDYKTDECMDLHYQTLSQAKKISKHYLDQFSNISRMHRFTIITGQGNHSLDKEPRIKPAVERIAREKGLRLDESNKNKGRVVIIFDGEP